MICITGVRKYNPCNPAKYESKKGVSHFFEYLTVYNRPIFDHRNKLRYLLHFRI